MWVILFVLLIAWISYVNSAKILGIIPTASYSHQLPFQPLWRELSLRGHQVTVMTTHPMKDSSLVNLTEIDMSYTRKIYEKYKFNEIASDESKSFLEIADVMMRMLAEADEAQLSSSEVQNLIHNTSMYFDLVVVEAQLPGMMAFSWRFKCPMVGISSLDSGKLYHKYMGNPNHPVANPDSNLPIKDSEDMSFKERLTSFIYNIIYEYVFSYRQVFPKIHDRYKKYFGEDLPPIISLYKNMNMLFVNTNPIFHNIRPLSPNTVAISGVHFKEPKPLPKELQEYLDNAKEGVIYFSLGSNVGGYQLTSIIEEILQTFSEIPYKVIVKIDLELENVPRNVKIKKWLPQQDLLRHPNVKLFITQGGLQSLQEGVINGIPLIGIPFFGDQFTNVNKMVKRGYGIKLDKSQITKQSLKDAIDEVMNNSRYRDRAKEISEILKDEEMPSLQRIVWWIEYVIRHKGAAHLRSPIVELPFWKFYMLDIMGVVGFIVFVFIFVTYKMFKFIFKKLLSANVPKLKKQ